MIHPKNLLQSFVCIAVLFLASYSYALPPAALPAVPSSVDSITPGELRMYLEFLASDELGGRYTLAPNFAISARYLATNLKADGFQGLGQKGDFLQSFDVISSKIDPAKTSLAVTLDGKPANYSIGDFFSTGGAEGDVEGAVVFVGSGISSPGQKHDDYAGLDVKKKIVLIAPGSPAGVDLSKVSASEQGEGAALSHGAIGIMRLPMRRMADAMRGKEFRQRFSSLESVKLAKESEAQHLPVITLGPDLAEKVLARLGMKLQDIYDAQQKHAKLSPKATDVSAHIITALQQTRTTTQNVVGIFKGTDAKLSDEYVVFSAHYDHLKTGPQGEVYHGADDDGSGTSAVLAIAHAISLNPPKRSVMVIFHAGEELGLLGSEYNTDYAPAVPLNKIMADLNIDMIGRSKPADDHNEADEHLTDAHSVYLVGSNRISQELHSVSEQTNADYQKMKLDYLYNDPNNPERIYYRSDHWNYAKHGIPVIFYFDGVHVDYHKPTDTVDKIDFQKLTDVTRLVFETGWRLANLDHELDKSN